MQTRCLIRLGLALAAACVFPALAQRRTVGEHEVQRVHRNTLLVDTHNDITSAILEGADFGARNSNTQTDLPRLKEGGVGAVFFAAYVAPDYAARNQAARRALEMIDAVRHEIVENHPRDVVLATSSQEILKARRSGKLAALIGLEGGHAIEDSLRLLRQFYALGVRYMTLTHTNTNHWADSSGDLDDPSVEHHNGLAPFGREVIAEMNRLGMMVDVSHVSDQTFWDVLACSRAPVIASHSSCRAISGIARNMSDEMIAALARKGGVIQINIGCAFLRQDAAAASPYYNPQLRARMKELQQQRVAKTEAEALDLARKDLGLKPVRANLDDVVAHIQHAVRVAGVGAVGIGTDFDGVGCVPEGLEGVDKFPALTRRLLEAGFSPSDIARIYGLNLLRVLQAVERVSESMRTRP